MGQAIERSAGEQIVVEDFSPFVEGPVAGNDQGAAFVPFGNDLVKILDCLCRESLQAEVIENEQGRSAAGVT